MRRTDQIWFAALALGAFFIWFHDRSWFIDLDDALPLLAAFPLLVWLVAPWKFKDGLTPSKPILVAIAAVTTVGGVILGLNVLLAIGWSVTLWAWLECRLEESARARTARLLPLALLAFPWLTLDFPSLTWWFRLSAAWSAEHFYQALGLIVERTGTGLAVAHVPFDVTPACSGVKALQVILVAGTAFCFLQNPRGRVYWFAFACLPAIAWLANTGRVIMIVATALSIGPEFAEGWFHAFGGWLVIVAVFTAMWLLLRQISRRSEARVAI